MFGLQWLRKAILRASGFKALHDEDAIFAEEQRAAAAAAATVRLDWYTFTVSFKGVFLEGLEVAFIVVTFGGAQHNVALAAAGAAAAAIVVLLVGLAVHRPLSRVPENTMKFAVGVMLTTFGMFWAGEGAGVDWPGQATRRSSALLAYRARDQRARSSGSCAVATPRRTARSGRVKHLARVRAVLVRLHRRRRLAGRPRRRRRRSPSCVRRPPRCELVVAAAARRHRLARRVAEHREPSASALNELRRAGEGSDVRIDVGQAGVHRVDAQMRRTGVAPALDLTYELVGVVGAPARPSLHADRRRVAACGRGRLADQLHGVVEVLARAHLREPAIREPTDAAVGGI